MSMYRFYLTALMAGMLAACGGGDPVVQSSSGSDDEDDGDTPSTAVEGNTSSFYPLQFFVEGDGYVDEAAFDSIWFNPVIRGYVIAPVNSVSLEPLEAPDIADYSVTINAEPVSVEEQGLMMQKIIGLPVALFTTIVIDTSGSNSAAAGVNQTALIDEVKDFIASAQASSDETISNQLFYIIAYANGGSGVEGLLPGFTSNAADLNSALDALLAGDAWEDRGSGSATYEAIVKAVGSYSGSGSSEATTVDLSSDGIPDLRDGYVFNGTYIGGDATQLTGIAVSNIVLVSSGENTVQETFQKADAEAALNWQSLLQFVEAEGTDIVNTSNGEEEEAEQEQATVEASGMPLWYVAVTGSGEEPDSSIAEMAASTFATNSKAEFSFATDVINAQISSVNNRIKPDNQYLVRYNLFERDGTHDLLFSSVAEEGYTYSLTTELDLTGFAGYGQAQPVVEITGPKNSYLPEGNVSLENVSTLYPATRWTVASYESADYSWTVGGSPRSANADGSITISSGDIGQAVVLTNDSLSSGTTTASLTVVQ